MPTYMTKDFVEYVLISPKTKLDEANDILDELRDDLYEADDLENEPESIKQDILDLEKIILLLQDHIELKKDKNSRLTELEKLYLQLKK